MPPPCHPLPSLPPALHGCGMVCMVSWGPNHSKTILETERMLVSQGASTRTPIPMKLPPTPGSSLE